MAADGADAQVLESQVACTATVALRQILWLAGVGHDRLVAALGDLLDRVARVLGAVARRQRDGRQISVSVVGP